MEEKINFPNRENEKLYGFLHKPENNTDKGVVLAHCFTCSSHQRIIRQLCHEIASNGFLVLRFDFSGNGDSEGRFEDSTYSKEMSDLSSAIDFIMSKGIDKLGILGHSMGSAVSILQSEKDERVRSLCILAGSSNPSAVKDIFDKKTLEKIYSEGEAETTIFGKKVIMKKEFFLDAEKQDLKKALKNFNRPFCVIHGKNDTLINSENAKRLYSYASNKKEIHIIKNADHLFSDEKSFEEIKNIVVGWFNGTI